jgi:hypothetical protein
MTAIACLVVGFLVGRVVAELGRGVELRRPPRIAQDAFSPTGDPSGNPHRPARLPDNPGR